MSDEVKETKINPTHVGVAVILVIVIGAFIWWMPSVEDMEELDFDITEIGITEPIINEIDSYTNQIEEKENRFQCEQWVEEGRFLVNKYSPETDTNNWTLKDKEKIDSLSASVLLKCTKTGEDLSVSEFNACYDTYYSIRVLLTKMTDMEIQSLSESDQELYYEKYDSFHTNDCNLIEEDLNIIYESTKAGIKVNTPDIFP